MISIQIEILNSQPQKNLKKKIKELKFDSYLIDYHSAFQKELM